ncbi:hypothetical protein [Burkholderia ubonensis]|uniref:hypothetical protein n=1 Tax=Burkholderia ubonensis TaxID=101571 RepID=UPI000A9FF09E|nr:hypothetical protein [Burkholderia ubonensis]
MGRFYAVNESASQLLSTCRTKADWYEAMNTLGIENAPQLDAEDEIRFWASKLDSIAHPAAKFFAGDWHAEYDETGDPNVCLLNGESVRAFLSQLEQLDETFFIDLFPHDGPHCIGHAWLYEPLCVFLQDACLHGHAVMILWEN